MRESGLAQRYAQALFGAALARGAEDGVAADLHSLLALDEKDASLRLFLESPQVRDDHKHALVDSVLGPRAQPLTVRFLHLLLTKKRTPYLREVGEAYAGLIEKHHGVVRARVTTVDRLGEDDLARLKTALERRTGKAVVLETRVDPEILGGVIVQLGDQILDDSVHTHLVEVREALLAAAV